MTLGAFLNKELAVPAIVSAVIAWITVACRWLFVLPRQARKLQVAPAGTVRSFIQPTICAAQELQVQVANMTSNVTVVTTWEDGVACATLMGTGLVALIFYGTVTVALYKLSKTMAGFRFIFSAAFPYMLCFIQFGMRRSMQAFKCHV